LGVECSWSSGGEFWYERGRWTLWNTETTYAEYKWWTIDGRSFSEQNIDFWSTNE
jgi:hypothetical protein